MTRHGALDRVRLAFAEGFHHERSPSEFPAKKDSMIRILLSSLLLLWFLPRIQQAAPQPGTQQAVEPSAGGAAEEQGAFLSYQARKDTALDPDPESAFWKDAKGIALDHSILGKPDPTVASEARSRWTKKYLYFLFWGPYDTLHLKPNPDTQHDTQHLWNYDDFELYLGSNFQNINLYHEFEISPQSEYLDMAIDATRARPGWNDEYLWNSGMTVKSRIEQGKKIWYGEMRIPIAAVDKRPAKIGNEFRADVFRLQHTGHGRGHFLAWRATGEWMPHHPDKFGILRLAGKP